MAESGDNSSVDLRSLVSHRIAGALNDGTNHVRVRIHLQQGVPQRADLLAHRDNQWHEASENFLEAGRLSDLVEDMEMLASQGHADQISVRQTTSPEKIDTDLQFDNEWVVGHRGKNLASAVEGKLFRDPHNSGQDIRRQSRMPRRGS